MKAVKTFWKSASIEEKLLWLYTATLPFINLPFCHFMAKKILFADLVFIVLLLVMGFKIFYKHIRFSLTPAISSLLVMLSSFVISCLNSNSIITSAVELSSLIYLMVLFVLIVNIMRDKEKLIRLLYVWIITSVSISFIGLTAFFIAILGNNITSNQFLSYSIMDSMAHHFPRIKATFAISNMFFSYLHTSFIVAVILFLLESSLRKKRVLSVCTVIILITSFLTGSRRLAGLLLSLFLILVLFGNGKMASLLKYITCSVLSVFLVAYIVTSIWLIFPVKIIKDEAKKTIGLTVNYSYGTHFLSPAVSANMFKRHPIIGVGIGTYNRNFKDYVNWEWLSANFDFTAYPGYIKLIKEKNLSFDPHSLYLGTLAETGLIGFFGLCFFIIHYILLLTRRLRLSGMHNLIHPISGCVIAGFIGFLLNALTMDILSMRHLWFMLAVGMSAHNIENG
ncbi:MAG: hypothetical protein FJZ16_02170 [Candidatus Omnitrophica bacterium]|nr:hypothetical protein [Candidatus Omnitrophota bacterium]